MITRSAGRMGMLIAGCLVGLPSAEGCPFCAKMARTWTDEIRDADAVVFGQLERISADSARIQNPLVIRPPAEGLPPLDAVAIKGISTTQPRLVWIERTPDLWKVIRLDSVSPRAADYLRHLWQIRDLPAADRLTFFFEYLDDPDARLATDAYAEFAKASYRSTKQASAHYDPTITRLWIDSPRSPPERIGLFGLLLGLAGETNDIDFLVDRVDHPSAAQLNGLDGLLGGLYLLDPAQGSERIVRFLVAPDASSLQRSSALSALRFILTETPPSPPERAILLRSILPALADAEVAGPLIDEFRKAQFWEAAPQILPMVSTLRDPSSVIRFALASPGKEAADWIGDLEKKSPSLVSDARQTLTFEASARSLDLSRPE
jgi:hypothetical protein